MDLRSNIAAEVRAKIVYERLINFTDDADSKDALQFLMTREITHMSGPINNGATTFTATMPRCSPARVSAR